MNLDLLLEHAVLPEGRTVSIGVAEGRIAAIGARASDMGPAREHIDLAGALVIPGLVDGHLHLDKSFIGDRWRPHEPGTSSSFSVAERVAIEQRLLAGALPVEQRACALIELAVSHGTTHIRSHVDIDPQGGLRGLAAVLDARARYRDAVSIQIVAFPQQGVVSSPGVVALMDEALNQGAEVVGGLDPAGFDRDINGQLDAVFGLAERHGAAIDIHLHDSDLLGVFELQEIAKRTRAAGLHGKVAVSHAYALGMVPLDTVQRVAAELAAAGVAILTNAPGDRPFPPILALRAAGVNVFAGSDNVRDAWWPYGDADMLERAMLVGYRSGFLVDEQLGYALDMATHNAARALGVAGYGIEVGSRADFVALAARSVAEAVVARPRQRRVYKGGRLVAQNGEFLRPRAR
jgi:cytosine deaminase